MLQRTRKAIILVSLLLFPVTLNYFSPYVSFDGAMNGLVSGSLILFGMLFLSGMFLGRAWCGWACPMAGLSEYALSVNGKSVYTVRLRKIRIVIFTVWFGGIIAMFVLAGGIKGIAPLHMTENVISVDEPVKYIVYFMVLMLFTGLTFALGKRGACHSICWMSPFLEGGYRLGRWIRLPQLRILSEPKNCISCEACDRKCQMGINVSLVLKEGSVEDPDCILCGECTSACKKDVLRFGTRKR